MSDLTTPAASSIALPVTVAPPSANGPSAPSFAAFCDVILGKIALPGAKERDRQGDAGSGNILPDKDKNVDPALAWLFGPISAPMPVPPPPTAPAVPPTLEAAPDIVPDVLMAAGAPAVEAPPLDPVGTSDIDLVKSRMANQPDAAPQLIKLPPLQPGLPANGAPTPPPVVAAALPALFALSMTDRIVRDDDSLSSLPPATAPLSQATTMMPIAPMGDAQRQTLDLGRQDWPQKMIDHIEALRDNADANDTSIRLKPEALGRVDIALRTHDNGAVSVRFTAEQPTTRTLLVDAAPQLAAAAEARGIRLSGTSVDLSGQSDQRSQPHADRAQPITNRLANSRGGDNQAVDDGRIA